MSVYINTYNQAGFVSETLDSVLSQKTNFSFHILVVDDASTDGTGEIIRKYVKRFPDRVSARIHKENYFRQGRRIIQLSWPYLFGDYIAFLDGDDVWTHPEKLERQILFMDRNPGCAVCQTLTEYWDEAGGESLGMFPGRRLRSRKLILDHLATGNFLQTSATMLRRICLPELPESFSSCPIGDYPLFALAARRGWIGTIPEAMVRYRVHSSNAWFGLDEEIRVKRFEKARNFVIGQLAEKDKYRWERALSGPRLPLWFRISRKMRSISFL